MKIDLRDNRVEEAVRLVNKIHCPASDKELEEVFERVYHCKIVSTDAPLHTQGYMEISEDKYYTWFLIQFGEKANDI